MPLRTLGSLLLAGLFTLAAPPPAGAFLDSLFGDDEMIIDTLDRSPWSPPLIAVEGCQGSAEEFQQGLGRDRNETGHAAKAEPKSESGECAEEAKTPPPVESGLVVARSQGWGPVQAPKLQALLEGILERLFEAAGKPGVPRRLVLSASADFGATEAHPDATIIIPFGLIDLMESEAEMAFVMAHEAAHVLLGHHGNEWITKMEERTIGAAELGIQMLNDIGNKLPQAQGQGQAGNDLTKAVWIARGVLLVSKYGVESTWDSEQESEADLLAVDLLRLTGYSSNGAGQAMRKFIDYEAQLAAQTNKEELYGNAVASGLDATQTSGSSGERDEGIISSAENFAALLLSEIFSDHPDPKERLKAMRAYEKEFYERERRRPDVAAWQSKLAATEFQDLQRRYREVESARQSMIEEDLEAAYQQVSKAVVKDYWTDFKLRTVFAELRLLQGQEKKAIANLEIALKAPSPTLEIYTRLHEIHWNAGRRDEAMNVLERARTDLDDALALYPLMIARHSAIGNTPMAESLVRECQLRRRANKKRCQQAMSGNYE